MQTVFHICSSYINMMRNRWIIIFTICSLSSIVSGVDLSRYKKCQDSGFCRRLRNITADDSSYTLLSDTFSIDDHSLRAELKNNKQNINLVLNITALYDNTFRIMIDELKSLHPRYILSFSLDGEPVKAKIKLVENNSDKGIIKVSNENGFSILLYSNPFKIDILDPMDEVVLNVNKNGLTTLEHHRLKPENGTDTGEWEESFGNFNDSKPRGPEAISADLTFPKASHLYGLPEHTTGFSLESTKYRDPYRLYNLDVHEYDLNSTMSLYTSIPILYSHGSDGNTIGVFWANLAETWVDIDVESEPSTHFMSEAGILDMYILLGPSPADSFRQYTRLTGTAPLPQMFSLAYHQCRWNYMNEGEVQEVHENFDLHDIPLDTIWLDIEYTNGKRYFTWDKKNFPRPLEMIANMTNDGRKMILIIDPHIKRDDEYFVHSEATKLGYYIKDKDKKDFEGNCWPGDSSYLDFFNPVVREYYAEKFLLENFEGTTKDIYIWNDMNEPAVFNASEITMPKDNLHYGEWEHRHLHNGYGFMQTWATYDGLMKRSKNTLRPFILTRSAFAGSQRYTAIWTGDNIADWPYLAISIPMCLSLAIGGFSFCGSDVGGFFWYPDAELMTRWYQAGAFQPFFRSHSHIDTPRREPYRYNLATTMRIRDAIRTRYAYLPFWYTLFYQHSINGLPVMRPIFMHYPKEKDVFDIDNEYLLGDSLLVHPVTTEGASSVLVHLPGISTDDIWYDIDTYGVLKPGKFQQKVDINKIPVYQRGGTIVPKKEKLRKSSGEMKDDPYTLIVTLSKNNTASGTLYIDDGESFDYKQKKYIYADLQYKNDIFTFNFIDNDASYPSKSYVEKIVVAGMKNPPRNIISISDPESSSIRFTYDETSNVLIIQDINMPVTKEWKFALLA